MECKTGLGKVNSRLHGAQFLSLGYKLNSPSQSGQWKKHIFKWFRWDKIPDLLDLFKLQESQIFDFIEYYTRHKPFVTYIELSEKLTGVGVCGKERDKIHPDR